MDMKGDDMPHRAFLFLLLTLTFPCTGQLVSAIRTDTPPVIDGLFEEAWETAIVIAEPFIQHRPDCGLPMTEPTEVALLYDDDHLYIAFRMHDSHPEEFTRFIAPRDQDFSTEWIGGIWLDTFNDDNNAYFFFTSVDNVQQDGRLCQIGGWDINWDAVWESATTTSDSGWAAEFAIPFSSLRYSGDPEQVWGVNFKRTITRTNESAFLFRMADNGSVRIEDFGELVGLSDLPDRRLLEFRPYGAARLDYLPESDEEWAPWGSAGADFRMGISSSAVLDLTINPDFGQIEADPDRVNLSHWESFLREKRPFFLEGSDLFDMPFSLFYSRRIGSVASNGDIIPILGGAKLTGAAGGFRFGALEAYTGRITENDVMLEPAANFAVVRVLREFGEGTYFGGSMTSTDIPGQMGEEYLYGRSAAVDGQLTLGGAHTIRGSLAGTWNSWMPRWSRNAAYRGSYSYSDERLACSAGFSFREEDFDANLIGYTSSTGDVNTWVSSGLFHPFTGSDVLQHGWLNLNGYYDRVPGGDITSRGVHLNTGVVFTNRYHVDANISLSGSHRDRYEGPSGTTYDGGTNFSFSCSSDSRRKLYAYLWGGFGDYREGGSWDVGTWLNLKPVPQLSLGVDLDWSATSDARRFNWSADSWDARSTDWRSLQLSGSYMMGNGLSLTLTSQLSRFESEYALTGRTLSTQQWMNLLLGWSFRPGSMFYFMAGEHAEPDETGELGDPGLTLFTKITWLIPV